MKGLHRCAGVALAGAFLTACSGAHQGSQPTSLVPGGQSASHQLKRDASGCIPIQDSMGAKYTAAEVGGGYYIDVESSATPCTIGIYINSKNGPNTLSYAAVNGPFNIGIYFDNAGKGASLSYASICFHGSTENYDGCVTGDKGRSPGTGLYIRKTPRISVDYTEIDSYAAGFAMTPCPNKANKISVDFSTFTNTVFAWSYAGGKHEFFDDAPQPQRSCRGSRIGVGVFPP